MMLRDQSSEDNGMGDRLERADGRGVRGGRSNQWMLRQVKT